jgi:adenylate cyclase
MASSERSRRLRRLLGARFAPLLVAFLVTGAALTAVSAQGGRVDPLSAALFDRFQQIAPRAYDPGLPVRIVAIDRESLQRYGQWPWSRTYFVELVDRLQKLGAAVIAFDILFADPDRTSPEVVAAAARRFDPDAPPVIAMREQTQHDIQFARRIANAPVVVGALPREALAEDLEAGFEGDFGLATAGSDPRDRLLAFAAVESPLEIIRDNAAGYGLTGVGDGSSAVVRRAPLFSTVAGAPAPSLAMEALRVAQGARSYLLRSSDASAEAAGGAEPQLVAIRVGGIDVPVSADGAAWLRFAGHQPARYVPAWRVLDGDAVDPNLRLYFEGQIVLVGATAPGLRYVAPTPVSPAMDGVEIHAETIEQIVLGVSLARPDWAPGAEALAVALCGLIAVAAMHRRHPAIGFAALALGVGALGWGAWEAFHNHGLLVSPVFPGLTLAGCFVGLNVVNYLQSTAQSRAVRSQFERFVAAEVIKEIVDDPERQLALRGEERELTVLFCDVRGFTTLSERMPPAELIALLNRILSALSDCVLERNGTVDKFMGDAVMAFWNAPVDAPDHRERAMGAARSMFRALDKLNADLKEMGLPPIGVGVGVNTGVCRVGLMGSERRLEYSCVGDAVNVASRLESMTKELGLFACIGSATAQAAGEDAVEIDTIAIRGRAAREPVYALPETDRAGIEAFRARVDAVRAAREAGDRDAFETALGEIAVNAPLGVDGDRLARHYRGSWAT